MSFGGPERHDPLEPVFVSTSLPAEFNVDEYHTNLPTIRPQELRIIGRCVSFSCDANHGSTASSASSAVFVFKGWVAHITKDTVTLLDAVRYGSHEEFTTAAGDVEGEISRFPLTLHRVAHAPSPLPGGVVTTVPKTGSFGRFPYATFQRRKIRHVKFEVDCPIRCPTRDASSFMNPTADSEWYPHDEQKVRMFVRRYLVHTSQGNNSQQLSLLAFVQTRLDWEDPNREVLRSIVKEEIEDLKAVDEDITNRTQQQQQQQQQQRGDAGAGDGTTVANMRRVFGASASGIPTRTSYTAIVHLAIGIGLLLYAASIFTTAEKLLVLPFVRSACTYAAIAGASLLVAGLSTGFHALRMTLPPTARQMAIRFFFTTLAAILVAYGIFALYRTMIVYQQIDGTSLYNFYLMQVTSSRSDVCDFFSKFMCSGFTESCNPNHANDECPTGCNVMGSITCQNTLQNKVRTACLPLFIMAIVAGVFLLIDYALLVKARMARRRF